MPDARIPILLALGAAFLFGVSTVTAKRGLMRVDAQTGSLVVIGTVVLLYLITSPFWMQAGDWFTLGFWIFVLNGFMHPFLSMYLAHEATARTGPTVAATLSATASPFLRREPNATASRADTKDRTDTTSSAGRSRATASSSFFAAEVVDDKATSSSSS